MGKREQLGILPDELAREELVADHAKVLLRSSRALGRFFETGLTKRNRPMSWHWQRIHQCNVAAGIGRIMKEGYNLRWILEPGDRDEPDRTYNFVRYYPGDFDQNPALISDSEEVVDIVDFCKAMHHGAKVQAVPKSETTAYFERLYASR